MPVIERSALVNHSAEQMFDLINDVARYPEYMQGCISARVLSEDEDHLLGELTLGRAGIEFTFTTQNSLQRPELISMKLKSGQFRRFSASWRFQALSEDACKVSLTMDFELDSSIVGFAAGQLFSSIANSQVEAFVERARVIYGNG